METNEPDVRYSPDSETLIAVELPDGRFTVVNRDGTSQIVWGDISLGGVRIRDWPVWHPARMKRAKAAIAEAKAEIRRELNIPSARTF